MLQSPASRTIPGDFLDAPPFLTLWLPYALLAAGFLTAAYDGELYWSIFNGEHSVTEVSTVLVLIAAITYGILGLLILRNRDRLLFAWLLLGTLGCTYFAGEEASWGQWFFQWSTPESWVALNDQNETNLHNITGFGYLLDQLPRGLLTLGALVGGICVPLWLRLRRRTLDAQRHGYWIWPTFSCLPVAILGVFISNNSKAIEMLQELGWLPMRLGAGEFKELYLAWFLMIYMISMHTRLRKRLQAADPS